MNVLISKLFAIREIPVAIALVIVLGVTAIANPAIISRSGALDIFLGVSVVAFLTVGQTLVISMKHVDLSVGSTIGFAAWLIGKLTADGHSLIFTLLIVLVLGLIIGSLNGYLVAYLELPSLVVTLATMYIVRGVFSQISSGRTIIASEVPKPISFIGLNSIFVVPYMFVVVVLLVLIAGNIMHRLRPARDLYAIGSNLPAAKLAGIPVPRRVFSAFLANGLLASFGGIILLSRFNAADTNSGMGLELNVIAACVVGGVAIAGGVGTVYGALIGAILLQSITMALGALGVGQFWQLAVNGLLLILAISLDKYLTLIVKPSTIMRVRS
jgi:rhamnose transport system permease protein